MKTKLYFFNFLVIMVLMNLMLCQQAFAVTASPYPFDYQQPDGSIVKIKMMGDEWVRWAETMDHYTLLRNAEGAWEYATTSGKGDIVPSGYLASNADDRSADELAFLSRTEKSLSFSKEQISFMRSIRAQQNERGITGFPTTGIINVLVILMEFQDVSFTKSQTDFDNLMNQVNYNSTGSFKDFHYENSYGNLTINTTVAGIYTANENMAYYGTNSPSDDYRVDELITEAVILADNDVNYADFDNDGDDDVDAVYVIYAGYGEEAGGGADAIWAHASGINWIQLDGVWISPYACSAELRSDSGSDITGIGVICHEFGHSLGAPDFYDVDYATNGQYDGTGVWDMMASGSWNSNGDIPAHHNPFTKYYYYNWLTPTTVSATQEITLRDISTYPDVVRINTTTNNEYFLLENRQQAGFNAACPGHGMIIYHVDGDYVNTHEPNNDINAGSHQGMYIMSATSTTDNGIMLSSASTINTAGCPWPGTSNSTTFDDATTPNSKSWAVNNTNKPVLEIREANSEIYFCLNECSFPGDFTAEAMSPSQVNLSWTLNSNSDPVIVAVNSNSTFGVPVDGTEYAVGSTIPGGGTVIYSGISTSYGHSGLDASTTYYYQTWSVQSGVAYTSANAANATTFCTLVTSFPWNEGFENGGSIPSCWTQENVSGSLDWEFRAGSSNGTPTTAHTGSYNANLATLSYSSPITKLITPAINLTAISSPTLKFWHTQEFWTPDQDELRVYYRTSGSGAWNLLEAYTSDVATWTERTISLPAASATYFIAFEGTANAGFGICIDDVEVSGTALPFWTGASDSDWNTSENWLNNAIPTGSSDVIISDVSTKPVINQTPGSPAICNNLIIQAGGSLTINPGKALTVNGTVTNSAGTSGLVIKSDATGTGSLIHETADVAASVERYVAKYNAVDDQMYHFISSPVEAQAIRPEFVPDPPTTGYDFMAWDEPGYQWLNSKTAAGDWNSSFEDEFMVGKGYLVAWPSDLTKTFSGELNSYPDGTPLVLTCTNTNGGGWNLLGNPFPSSIDWDLVEKGDGMDNALYYYDNANQNYKYYISLGGYGVGGGSQYIPPMQGFMVHAKPTGAKTLSLNNADRVHNGSDIYYKSEVPNLLTLQLQGNNRTDEAVIFFHPSASTGFDSQADAYKLLSSADVVPQVYSITSSGTKLAINTMPDLSLNPDVFIGIKIPATGSYKLKATGIETLIAGSEIFLHDDYTGTDHSLNVNPEYPFETYISGEINDRFVLRFKGETGISTLSEDVNVYYCEGYIMINITEEMIGQVSISNLLGQTILNKRMNIQKETVIPVHTLKPGAYVVQVTDGKKILNKKFVVL